MKCPICNSNIHYGYCEHSFYPYRVLYYAAGTMYVHRITDGKSVLRLRRYVLLDSVGKIEAALFVDVISYSFLIGFPITTSLCRLGNPIRISSPGFKSSKFPRTPIPKCSPSASLVLQLIVRWLLCLLFDSVPCPSFS